LFLLIYINYIILDTKALKLIEHKNDNKGFENIANMAGGMVEWERDGLPLKIDKTERLSGSCACMLRKRENK